MTISDCTGVVLAGGRSRRFGSNKALADRSGRELVSYPCRVMEQLFAKTLLITNTPDEYRFLGWPMTGDLYRDAGPLGGIHAALSATDTPLVFVAGCDMPYLDPGLIIHLHGLAADFDVVIPWTERGPEPLHSFYRRHILEAVTTELEQGTRKIMDILPPLRVRQVAREEIMAVSQAGLDSFININTPDDLERNG